MSDLVFLANIIVLIIFLFQAALGERVVSGVYMACLAAMAAGFAGVLLSGHGTVSLYYSGTVIQITDAVGATASTLTVSALLSPTAFRSVFLKMMSMELIGRLTANGLFWLLSSQGLTPLALGFGLSATLLHLVAFMTLSFRLDASARAAPPATTASGRVRLVDQLARAVRFILQNPLLKTALFVMLWTHVTKILVELSFFGAVERYSVGVEGIGMTLSGMTMLTIALTLAVQKTFGNRLNKRLRISTLLLILPVGTLILSTTTYLSYSLVTMAALMIFFQVTNRAIEMPTSRQCLVPVPAQLRGSIISLISLAMAFFGMVAGGTLSSLHAAGSPSSLLGTLILLGFVGLLGLSDLDSDYFQNLWRFVRERVSGRPSAWLDWLPAGPAEQTSTAQEAERERDRQDAVPLLEQTYRAPSLRNRSDIERLVRDHREVLGSSDASIRDRGFDLLWRLNPRWARRFAPTSSDFLAKRDAIEAVCNESKERFGLSYFEASALRAVILSWSADLPRATSDLQDILEHGRTDRRWLLRAMYKSRSSRTEIEALRRAVVGAEPVSTWLKLVAVFPLAERGLLEVALDLVARRRTPELDDALTANVAELTTVSVPLLYLEERLLLGDKAIPVSELSLLVDQFDDAHHFRLVADLHLEILKGSRNEDAWRRLLVAPETQS